MSIMTIKLINIIAHKMSVSWFVCSLCPGFNARFMTIALDIKWTVM